MSDTPSDWIENQTGGQPLSLGRIGAARQPAINENLVRMNVNSIEDMLRMFLEEIGIKESSPAQLRKASSAFVALVRIISH